MLHGWCQRCHKVKRVRVSVPSPNGVQIGTCADCENRRNPRRMPPRRRDRREVGPCPCECNAGGFCGGCGHAGCGGR